jgi:hypothetical protein
MVSHSWCAKRAMGAIMVPQVLAVIQVIFPPTSGSRRWPGSA